MHAFIIKEKVAANIINLSPTRKSRVIEVFLLAYKILKPLRVLKCLSPVAVSLDPLLYTSPVAVSLDSLL